MTGFQIDFDIVTKVIEAGIVVVGAWFAMKAQIQSLQRGQTEAKKELHEARLEQRTANSEQLRQLAALHKRLDSHGMKIQQLDKQNAVIWDRITRSQRIPAQAVAGADALFTDGWDPSEEGKT